MGRSRETAPELEDLDPFLDRDRYRRIAVKEKRTTRQKLQNLGIGLGVLVVLVGGTFLFVQSLPASISLNGATINVGGAHTLADAQRASGIKPQPGDYVAVDGSVLKAGEGKPFYASVNGQEVDSLDTPLKSGDVVEFGNGRAIEEPADIVEEVVPFVAEQEGDGAIHLLEGTGADGLKRIKTGHETGMTVEEMITEPENIKRRNVSPQVGDDKVIALTFDDGPWAESTAQVLDVLAKHDAKATFFTVGNRIDGSGVDLVRRAAEEGHQICTHSFSHAAGNGQSVDLGLMSDEEQRAEIENGFAAIQAATGTEASHVIRTPGGNYSNEVMHAIGSLITAEIGWDVDSQDWRKPGAGAIAAQIESAWSGAIVLLHDGGGDREQTVKALEKALPYLKDLGYRFVTIDQLMEYPLE